MMDNNMVAIIIMVAYATICMGFIGAGLVVLHHFMKKWELQSAVESMKTKMLPEVEAMANRMLDHVLETTMTKTTEMVEKMTKGQYADY